MTGGVGEHPLELLKAVGWTATSIRSPWPWRDYIAIGRSDILVRADIPEPSAWRTFRLRSSFVLGSGPRFELDSTGLMSLPLLRPSFNPFRSGPPSPQDQLADLKRFCLKGWDAETAGLLEAAVNPVFGLCDSSGVRLVSDGRILALRRVMRSPADLLLAVDAVAALARPASTVFDLLRDLPAARYHAPTGAWNERTLPLVVAPAGRSSVSFWATRTPNGIELRALLPTSTAALFASGAVHGATPEVQAALARLRADVAVNSGGVELTWRSPGQAPDPLRAALELAEACSGGALGQGAFR